jgi:hypothetical protein
MRAAAASSSSSICASRALSAIAQRPAYKVPLNWMERELASLEIWLSAFSAASDTSQGFSVSDSVWSLARSTRPVMRAQVWRVCS